MGCKIIVADRSPSVLKAAELALPGPEFEVAPDAVLAGLSLPSRDGYEVADFVKSLPQGRQVAVFFLRGPFEPIDAAKIAPIDHDGIVAKPFDGESLIALVRAAVDRRKELPSLPEEPVRVKIDPPPAPADRLVPLEWTAELEQKVRELVRREIGLTRKDIEALAREIVMTEFKKMLVEELKNIDTRKF
jgi:CheY-like chemotaxis protein